MPAKKYFWLVFIYTFGICVAAPFLAGSQPNPKTFIPIIDSVRVKRGQWTFLDPNNVKETKLVRDDPHYHTDIFYITLKDHQAYFERISGKFLSPDAIAKRYIRGYNKNTQVIFIWNDKLLVDTAEAGVPERYFIKAEVLKTTKTAYSKTLPGAVFFKIYSKQP